MDNLILEKLKSKLGNLPKPVIQKLLAVVEEYEGIENDSEPREFEFCPKCGTPHPVLIKAGMSGSGVQMLQCKSCMRRFCVNHGTLSFRSHLDARTWDEAVRLVLQLCTIEDISRRLGVTRNTALRLRHKIMHPLVGDEDGIQLSGSAELDEKYVLKSHKGRQMKDVEGRRRGGKSSKRGISNDQVCLLTGCQREGMSFLRSYNVGRPSACEVLNLKAHIEAGTFLWTDSSNSYNRLALELGSRHLKLSTHDQYHGEHHLNNVNCLHSKISGWYSSMKGVATVYINRYAALFNMMCITRKMEMSKAVRFVKDRIASSWNSYISFSDLKQRDLFTPDGLVWG